MGEILFKDGNAAPYYQSKSLYETNEVKEYGKVKPVLDDELKIWYPEIEILNKENLTIKKDPTLLFLDKGYARCLYHCVGTISIDMHLGIFPFPNFQVINIRIVGNIGEQNKVKLFYRQEKQLEHVLTMGVIHKLTAWRVLRKLNAVQRMNEKWSDRRKEFLQKRRI